LHILHTLHRWRLGSREPSASINHSPEPGRPKQV
jgi:hypothetical protein